MSNLILVSADLDLFRIKHNLQSYMNKTWMYAGQDVRLRIRWENTLVHLQPRVNLSYQLQEAADSLSDDFNLWIDTIGQSNSSLFWWLGQIAEKNPFVSSLFFNLCYFKTIIDYIHNNPDKDYLVVVENHALRRTLSNYAKKNQWQFVEIDKWFAELQSLKKSVAEIFYGLLAKINLAKNWISLRLIIRDLYKYQSRNYSEHNYQLSKTILFHSWVRDDSIDSQGEFIDQFFGKLPDFIKSYGFKVQYFHLPLSFVTKSSGPYYLLKPLADKGLLFPSHNYYKIIDLFKAMIYPIFLCWKPLKVQKFNSWEINDLILQDRWSQVWSSRTSAAYMYYLFAARLGERGVRFNKIVGTFENHIWEKSFNLGVRHFNVSDEIVGYQHTTLNWNYHCYSPKLNEFKSGVLPDRVICSGSIWESELIKRGYSNVDVGGALRFEFLSNKMESCDRDNNEPIILVAVNAGGFLTLEVLRQVYLAFKQEKHSRILIKVHPHLQIDSVDFDTIFDGNKPSNFEVIDRPMSELLLEVDLLIYSSTSVCLEALAMGVPVISVIPETFLDLDDLRLLPNLRCATGSYQELFLQSEKILGRSQGEYEDWLSKIGDTMTDVFSPVTVNTLESFILSEESRE